MGGKKKYINIFGSFTEPFNYHTPGENTGANPVHQSDNLQNKLVLSKIISVFKYCNVLCVVFCPKRKPTWHQCTLYTQHRHHAMLKLNVS